MNDLIDDEDYRAEKALRDAEEIPVDPSILGSKGWWGRVETEVWLSYNVEAEEELRVDNGSTVVYLSFNPQYDL